MERILKKNQRFIFILPLLALFACSEPPGSDKSIEQTTPVQPETATASDNLSPDVSTKEKPILNLELPEDILFDQKAPAIEKQSLLPELVNREKAESKFKLNGQVLMDEDKGSGIDAVDGAEVKVTVKK